MQSTNRAILLTAPTPAAIAVVRLLGPAVDALLAQHFSRPVPPNRAVHGEWRITNQVLDDPVVVRTPAGADVNLHGGPWIVSTFLDHLRHAGFAITEPDLDAFDGPTTLDREVSAALPLARTDLAVQTLIAQPAAWSNLLQSLDNPTTPGHSARTPSEAPPRIRSQAATSSIDQVLADPALHHLLHPPRVAILGPPNVGKSTLANQLFARDRAITADLPGTTRDWVGEPANLDGLVVALVDTPGVRATADPIESAAITASAAQVRAADLVLIVLDAALPLAPQLAALGDHPNVLRIANKSDRPPVWDLATHAHLRTVATIGQGINALRAAIRSHFGIPPTFDPTVPRCWTPRQRDLLVAWAARP
ncbi:MAG TPA: GTPase [Tepidisphaeraceae bacterium]|nr:GTPase [Tepidisphaeraceae bacterium]